MMKGPDSKSERGLRWALPSLSILGLIILMQLPYRISFLDNLLPFLPMAAVYYWGIFKPNLVPVSAVFILGLLQDILSGGPLGMMALLLILVRLLVVQQGRRFLEREFLFSWMVFFVVSLIFGLATWAIASIYLREPQYIWDALGQSMLTIAVFPVIVWGLGLFRLMLVAEKR